MAKTYHAVNTIRHGMPDGAVVEFAPGEKVTGLTKDEMVLLWQTGALEEQVDDETQAEGEVQAEGAEATGAEGDGSAESGADGAAEGAGASEASSEAAATE